MLSDDSGEREHDAPDLCASDRTPLEISSLDNEVSDPLTQDVLVSTEEAVGALKHSTRSPEETRTSNSNLVKPYVTLPKRFNFPHDAVRETSSQQSTLGNVFQAVTEATTADRMTTDDKNFDEAGWIKKNENRINEYETQRPPPDGCFSDKKVADSPPSGVAAHAMKRYIHPRPAFVKTQAFLEALNLIAPTEHTVLRTEKVVHIYGMSGSGKSQIVRGICKHLDKRVEQWIIWHVQSQEGSSLLAEGLNSLMDELERYHLVSTERKNNAVGELGVNRTKALVAILVDLNQNVLLAFEDVATHERVMAADLIQNLDENRYGSLQVLIASQKKDSIFTKYDIDAMCFFYQTKKISGFTKDEATKFLKTSVDPEIYQHSAVEQLAEALAYSPLRLTLSKSYCARYRVPYKTYFDTLGKDEAVIEKEKNILNEFPELAKYHGYEVILRAIRPKNDPKQTDGDREEEFVQFSVLKMMCFLSNNNIPEFLIGKIFQQVKRSNPTHEKKMVRYLLTKLESSCDANVLYSRNAGPWHDQALVSLHRDILLAVGLHMDANEKQDMFVKVLHSMASLVKKENRLRSDSTLLFRLLEHLDRVIYHASEHLTEKYEGKKADMNKFEIQLSISRIYEVLGFGIVRHEEAKDHYLGKSIAYIWELVCSYSKNPTSKKDKIQKRELLKYGQEKDPERVARKAYKYIKEANKKIPDEYVVENWKTSYPVTELFIKDWKDNVGENCDIDWEAMLNTLNQNSTITENQISLLRKCKLLLNPKELKSVYLCERIASIMHSRGRQVLFILSSTPQEEKERYDWYTEVGLLLCREMARDAGIHSLFEYILESNNKLPRMLKNRPEEDDASFRQRIEKVRNYAKRLCYTSARFYEHGMYKTVSGTDYTVMNALRFLVKANTKLYKRPHLAPAAPSTADVEDCDRLYNIAKRNVGNFVVSSNCMIQAGKYYAAIGDFTKAMEAFRSGFDENGMGIEHQQEKYPDAYAWALHNIGMTICAAGRNLKNLQYQKEMFMDKYKKAFKCCITRGWAQKLAKIKTKIEEIVILHPLPWSDQLRILFTDSYVDQLEAEAGGDILKQVKRCHEYLTQSAMSSRDTCLRKNISLKEWKDHLYLDEGDMEEIKSAWQNEKERTRRLALLFLENTLQGLSRNSTWPTPNTRHRHES